MRGCGYTRLKYRGPLDRGDLPFRSVDIVHCTIGTSVWILGSLMDVKGPTRDRVSSDPVPYAASVLPGQVAISAFLSRGGGNHRGIGT